MDNRAQIEDSHTAEAGSPTADALVLLASWAATQDVDAVTSGAPA